MTTTETSSNVNRRVFLRRGAGAAAGLALAQRLDLFGARAATADPTPSTPTAGRPTSSAGVDYGPLLPTRDQATGLEQLMLPRGFEYLSYGWTRDAMDDGRSTPASHDGMAAFRGDDKVRLVRTTSEAAPAVRSRMV